MKIYVRSLLIAHFFLELEMFQIKVVKKKHKFCFK